MIAYIHPVTVMALIRDCQSCELRRADYRVRFPDVADLTDPVFVTVTASTVEDLK